MRKSYKILSGCLAIPVLAIAAFVAYLLFVHEPPTAEEKAADEAEVAEMRETSAHRYAQLATVYRNLHADNTDTEVIPCDPGAMTKERDDKREGPVQLSYLYSPYLERFADETAWTDDFGDWDWLIDEKLTQWYSPPAELDRGNLYRISHGDSYLVILHPASEELNRMPEMAEGGFNGGVFLGTVQVVDVDTAEVVCRAPLAVASSDEIRPILKKAADHALLMDFRESFAAAVGQALNGAVEVDFGRP